jgi:hypothetical protein
MSEYICCPYCQSVFHDYESEIYDDVASLNEDGESIIIECPECFKKFEVTVYIEIIREYDTNNVEQEEDKLKDIEGQTFFEFN